MSASLIESIGVAFLIGLALGSSYFVALWATVRRLPQLRHPAVWMALSLLARLAVVLGALVLVVRSGGGPGLAAALAGFVLARTVLVRRAKAGRLTSQDPP